MVILLAAATTLQCASVSSGKYRGWKTQRLTNGIISVEIAPELGGRVIALWLGEHQFLWSNESLAGTVPPDASLDAHGQWLNYGGDKLWPAPQGWSSDKEWPGPPDPALDGSAHRIEVLGEKDAAAIRLTSRDDPLSGIRFSRVVRVENGGSHVAVDAEMLNVDTKPRRWGIWTNTQVDAGSMGEQRPNPNFFTYIPINPHSAFASGYRVLFGDATNPEIHKSADGSLLQIHFLWKVGKVGLDSQAGWVANVDGTHGYLFVQEFKYEPGKPYPDGSSVELWTNGQGRIHAWGRDVDMSPDPKENPFVVETEVISPFADLQPGQRSSFHYDWYVARIGGDFPILSCSDLGCRCANPTFAVVGGKLRLSGRYGVFWKGKLEVRLLDRNGNRVGTRQLREEVDPRTPLVLENFNGELAEGPVQQPVRTVSLVAVSAQGQVLGELDRFDLRS